MRFSFLFQVEFFLLSHVSLWVSDDNNVCHVLTSVSWELLHNSSLSKHQQQPKQCSVQSSASLGRLHSLFSHVLLILMFLRQISYTNISNFKACFAIIKILRKIIISLALLSFRPRHLKWHLQQCLKITQNVSFEF